MTDTEQLRIFETWLKDHQQLLFKVVRVYAFTMADQDDLFQEIALQVWRSVPGFGGQAAVGTWLYRVSLNTALQWTRKERKHHEGRLPIDGEEFVLRQRSAPVDEKLVWLYEEISKLDETDRSVTLLMLDGFSYKEMSEVLGISESHVGVKIHRIKKQLIAQSQTYKHHGI